MKLPSSALNRPLDPHYPTNLAVIVILPIAGLIAAGIALAQGCEAWQLVAAALGGAGAAFGGWALTRELAPDDNSAAFVSMALAYATWLLVDHSSVMLLILGIMLVRMVNRSVGIPPQPLDYLGIVGLMAWVGYQNRNVVPWTAIVADIPWWAPWTIAAIGLGYVGVIVGTRQVRSVTDLTGEPLQVRRVRAGMVVGLVVGLTGLLPIAHAPSRSALVWAVLLGIVIGRVRLFGRSSIHP